MINPGLSGKVVLVTGASNPLGIGAAIADAFAAQGAAVFITYLAQDGEPAEVLARLRGHGGRVASAAADLADPTVISPLFDRATTELGPVEVLVNNAAHSTTDTFVPSAPDTIDWAGRQQAMVDVASHDAHFAVNSRAVALSIAEFARRHVARDASWGRIINISTQGAHSFPGEISYGASKAALESYSRAAAVELGPYGITVNIVAPGPIQTGWIPEELMPKIAAETALGRVGRPDDIADVVVFLASEQARWITGQLLWVGGGHHD